MSIDARISDVLYNDDGTATLDLVSRDRYSGPGQSVLHVENPPKGRQLDSAIGCCIWGNASTIMIGNKKWADRLSYLTIRLVSLACICLCGCIPATVAKDAPQSLSSFRIAAAHVAIERPKLPDSLKGKTDENETGSVADDRPLCVLYRERWMEIADCDEIDQRFRVVVKGSDAIPDAIRKRGFRLPIVHWNAGGGKNLCAEYRGASDFNLRLRELPGELPVRVQQQVTIRGSNPHWTHPGDIYEHLRTTHGQDAAGLTREQALSLHDALHEGRAVSGNCPGGVCPVRRRR